MLGDSRYNSMAMALLAAAACSGTDDGSHINAFTAPTSETHLFPIGAGAVHEGVDCNSCHGGFDSFSEFNCLGCHLSHATNPAHSGVSGYSYSSPACYECHPDGTANGGVSRDGHTAFPINAGTRHESVACASCHVDSSDREVVDCATCHATETNLPVTHALVRGYVEGRSDLCLRCHPNADVPITVTQHNTAELRLARPHDRCLDCHIGLLPEKPFPAASFAEFSCEGACHEHTKSEMDSEHRWIFGYSYDFERCIACHPDADD